jgi:4-amino-4-deoxy-L-arabinose transferase-like glycosyltransferase
MPVPAQRSVPVPVLLAAFVAISLITRWISLVVPILDIDESAHIVGSWEMLRGRLLYTEFVNNKPPLLYVYYAVAQAVFGRSLIGVHAFTAIVTVPLTALGVSAFFHHARRGVLAGATFLVYSAAFIGHDMLASHAEVPMMLAAAWAVVLLRDESGATRPARTLASGALFGIAFLFKYQVAVWLPGIALVVGWTAWRRQGTGRSLGSVAALIAGALVPPLLAWLWFRARGGDAMLVYWTLRSNLAYSSNPIRLAEALERFASYAVPFAIVTAPLWWGTWRLASSDEPPYRRWLAWTLVMLSLPPVMLGFRFYPHYFIQLYVPLALAAAPWLEGHLAPPATRAGRRVAAWSLIMLVGFMASTAFLYFGTTRVYRERDPVFHLVADRLRADACAPRATLFVWGYAPPFYYYADMPAASRFVVMAQSRLTGYMSGNLARVRDPREAKADIVPAHWDWLMDDLERNRATFILDTAPAGIYRWNQYPVDDYPRLRDYLASHYDLVDTVGRVHVYRRRGCAGG